MANGRNRINLTVSASLTNNSTIVSKCKLFTSATAGFWLLGAGPAYALAGTLGLEGLSIAALLCLVPGWIVLVGFSKFEGPNAQAMAVLAGMGFRMFFVLLGVLVVRAVHPQLQMREFFIWILYFYLATLAVETYLVLNKR